MKTLKERYYESSEEYVKFELFMKELNKLNDESLDENVLKKVAKSVKARYLELSRRMKKVAKSAIAKFKRKRTQTRKKEICTTPPSTKTSKDEGHQKTVR